MFRREEGGETFAFTDLIFLMLLGFIVVLRILWPYINDPAKESTEPPPGIITVQTEWPDEIDADIDLWVKTPGDARPIGYSNLGGDSSNLLRDDLGKYRDPSNHNAEFFASRHAGPGDWVVNLHYFALRSAGTGPELAVKVWVTRQPTQGQGHGVVLIERTVTLSHVGEETTVFRFRTDSFGELIPDSINERFMALRSPGRAQP